MVIHVDEHEHFQREGQIIFLRLPVSMARAALGCEVEVPTIHGTTKLKIPEGTQSGEHFTLRGEGVPSLHGGSRGDMIVEVQVQTPTRLSKEQKELLCQFDELCQGEEEGFFSRLFHGARGKHKKKAGKEEKVAHG